jgi:hypothetical protein
MLNTALLIFAIGAVGGIVLALHVLRGKFAPWFLSVAHALLGATGLVLLILVLLKGGADPKVTWALAIFVVAALGGFYLASLHLRKQLPPKAAVVIHALLAVTGFAVLLAVVLGVGAA